MTATVNYGEELPLAQGLSLMKAKIAIVGSGNIGVGSVLTLNGRL